MEPQPSDPADRAQQARGIVRQLYRSLHARHAVTCGPGRSFAASGRVARSSGPARR